MLPFKNSYNLNNAGGFRNFEQEKHVGLAFNMKILTEVKPGMFLKKIEWSINLYNLLLR